jgi:broad specificity phosphatase PhoE
MAKLILVKHALPVIAPDTPSPRWVLSDEGRERCGWLAGELEAHGVERLCCSLEPKALETAALVGVRLGLAVSPREGLQENDRTGLAFSTADELRDRIRRLFALPDERVMGREAAREALERFSSAVRAAIAEAPDRTTAIVAHGTVTTLLVMAHNPIEPFAFWERLGLPSYVVLDAADFRLTGPAVNFAG